MKLSIVLVSLLICLTNLVSAQDTVHVKTGWNIIGSVNNGATPEILSSFPDSNIVSSFFGYAQGYQATDTLERGYGYWVKVKADGLIIFHAALATDECRTTPLIYLGRVYSTVKIGSQCWMAENLDAGTMIIGASAQSDNGVLEKYCYLDNPQNCTLYGGYYQWNEAMQYGTTTGGKGICPTGWHLPTGSDLVELRSTAGWDGRKLKMIGQGTGDGAGTNTSGFSALLSGFRYGNGTFGAPGITGSIWGSEEWDAGNSRYMFLYQSDSSITVAAFDKTWGLSVRCIKD